MTRIVPRMPPPIYINFSNFCRENSSNHEQLCAVRALPHVSRGCRLINFKDEMNDYRDDSPPAVRTTFAPPNAKERGIAG
jgi:hypothetical protein